MSLIEEAPRVVLHGCRGELHIEGAREMTLKIFVEVVHAGFCPHVIESALGQLQATDRARWVLRARKAGRA